MRRTTLICWGLTALMAGLFVGYYGFSVQTAWLIAAFPSVYVIYKFEKLRLPMLVVIGLLIGGWRGSAMFVDLQKYQPLYGESVALSARVADDSGYNTERRQTEFHITNVRTDSTELPGRLQIGVREDPQVTRGDTVLVRGKLRPSLGTSRQGTISMAEVKILSKNTSWLEDIRGRFFAAVEKALPNPQNSLGIGYLVGLRVNIPKDLNEQLAITGLTHIIAVSGYNVTILVRAVRRVLGKRSAYQSVVFAGLLVVGFLLVAGGSPSINRAAVVCIFSLVAWYYGREIKPLLLLLLSGGLTAFVNPLYIWGDPGWYLSFLAFVGVLILAPLHIRRYFQTKPPGAVSQILIETMCAQACTIPYTLYLFGGVSIISPLANVLVLPFIPLIMMMVLLVGMIGLFSPGLASFLAIIPNALLTLQLWIVERLSQIPWAHSTFDISIYTMLLLFAALIILMLVLHKKVTAMKRSGTPEVEYDLV